MHRLIKYTRGRSSNYQTAKDYNRLEPVRDENLMKVDDVRLITDAYFQTRTRHSQ